MRKILFVLLFLPLFGFSQNYNFFFGTDTTQSLSLSNDTLSLVPGNSVVLPFFSGAWGDLTDVPDLLTSIEIRGEISDSISTISDNSVDISTLGASETFDFEGLQGGIFERTIGSRTTSTFIFSNQLNEGTYAIRLHSGTGGDCTITLPGNCKSLDNSALGSLVIPDAEGKLFTFYYNGTDYIFTNE